MSEFKELIKSFTKSREYIRDFFVYGFKTRDDFTHKSARTYDNERRRIESWLSGYIQTDYTAKGKNLSLAIDSNTLDTNPLYRVWKTRSFTDNDIMLHFILLDYLISIDSPQTVEVITDNLLSEYDILLEVQLIRRKCNEYAREGLIIKSKSGREVTYSIAPDFKNTLANNPLLLDAIKFFSITSPLGVVGDTILDNCMETNYEFRVKHSFLVHTLEDEVMLDILEAINSKRNITFMLRGSKSDREQHSYCTPLQIFVSTRTGRRFLCGYYSRIKRFFCTRLDSVKSVTILDECPEFDYFLEKLNKNKDRLWGVSFQNGSKCHTETIKLTLFIDEKFEQHIIGRLRREGKGGTITRIADNTFTYENEIFDVSEMKPWIRTFIGRIIDIESSNQTLVNTIKQDLREMYNMYDLS